MFERLLALIEKCIAEVHIDPVKIKKILVVDLNFRGDMLMSSPVMRALKENIPGVQVEVMCWPFCVEVLQANPYIDRIWPVKRLNPWNAFKAMFRDYDLVMQLNTSLKTNFWMFFMGSVRLGYNYRHRGCFNNVRPESLYRTARDGNRVWENIRLLVSLWGVWQVKNVDMIFEVVVDPAKKDTKRKNIVIHTSPGQDFDKRRWRHFVGLADMIVERYGDVIFTGSYADTDYVEIVRQTMRHKTKTTNLCGVLSIQEFAELLCSTKLLVTVNTFAMHLGAALQTPTVAIIGGTPAGVVTPLDKTNFRYVEDPGLAEYDPETALYPIRINEITTEQVMEQINLAVPE